MNRYSVDVTIIGTVYVLASSEDEARAKITRLVGSERSPETFEAPGGDINLDDERSFLSAAFTLYGPADDAGPQQQELFYGDEDWSPYENAARASGYAVRHDLAGFYVLTDEEAEHEDAGNPSMGFDRREHYPDIADAWIEAAARAAGWEQGGDGDIWWHSSHGSWKNAASWGRTYATAREVIESDDYPEYPGREDER